MLKPPVHCCSCPHPHLTYLTEASFLSPFSAQPTHVGLLFFSATAAHTPCVRVNTNIAAEVWSKNRYA